jgi:putative flippase GtrA
MKYKAFRSNCAIAEIPIIFPDRTRGVSKMPSAYLIKALVDVWRIKFYRLMNNVIGQMIKFAAIGGLGTITNLLLFFLLVDVAKLQAIPVSIACFLVSGTQNYYLHHKWSFAQNTQGTAPSIRKWLLFLTSALLGLSVNITLVSIMLKTIVLPYKVVAQACGILAGMAVNFVAAKFVVFRRKYAGKHPKENS